MFNVVSNPEQKCADGNPSLTGERSENTLTLGDKEWHHKHILKLDALLRAFWNLLTGCLTSGEGKRQAGTEINTEKSTSKFQFSYCLHCPLVHKKGVIAPSFYTKCCSSSHWIPNSHSGTRVWPLYFQTSSGNYWNLKDLDLRLCSKTDNVWLWKDVSFPLGKSLKHPFHT